MGLDLSITRNCGSIVLEDPVIATMLKAQCSFFQELDVLKFIPAAVPHAPQL